MHITSASTNSHSKFRTAFYTSFLENSLEQGALSVMQPNDAFWGDRVCQVKDIDGFMWMFAKKL